MPNSLRESVFIVVTSDLGRVTTAVIDNNEAFNDCGDVRSRTSYNSVIL